MTRPNIVRADTLDLQDQTSPSAADHQKPTLHGGLGPHLRAEVHHVIEERNSEEHALADAWKMADNLSEEPEAIDEAQQQHNLTNGTLHHERDEAIDGEGSEADADDEMMDRVSSSPSIDDGGYTLTSSPSSPPTTPRPAVTWPERKSSLSPSPASLRVTFNQSASPSSPPSSSPFAHTPQHLPLHVRRTGKAASPLRRAMEWASTRTRPAHLPSITVEDADEKISFVSEHHQQLGRYRPLLDRKKQPPAHQQRDEGFYDDNDGDDNDDDSAPIFGFDFQLPDLGETIEGSESGKDDASGTSVVVRHPDATISSMENLRGNAFAHRRLHPPVTELEQSPSLTSMASVELCDLLLPADDPLLDTPPSPTNSSDSWESASSSSTNPLLDSPSDGNNKADDDTDALFLDLEDRFIDSGWGGECLRETEDIDFEFVYAFHTFVATVEGQANATKGDTMVLLDDSNSYWWLVRIVKDGSIGYLPAEHIETPTERLARLNKHRNVDLSATMLSDNSEKTRNPFTKLRRRNVKTVQFAAPTYVEASDYEYDDDDEEDVPDESFTEVAAAEEAQQNGEQSEEIADKSISEDEAPRSTTPNRGSFDREQAAMLAANADDPQLSPKLVDKTEAAPLKSRKGRNTDSFLKDDTIETRKITLTPGLLREEQNRANAGEALSNDSLETLTKQVSPPDSLSKKDSKKEKEKKKDGMWRGLFKSKKKDKKSRDDGDSIDEKMSGEYLRDSPPVVSPLASGRSSPGQEPSSVASSIDPRLQQDAPPRLGPHGRLVEPTEEHSNGLVAELEGSSSAADETASLEPAPLNVIAGQQEKLSSSPLSPITNILKRDDSKSGKPAKAKRAKQRVELDDFDSPEAADGPNPFEDQDEQEIPAADKDVGEQADRLSESPVELTSASSMHGTESIHIPTPSPYDQPGMEDDDDDEPESMTSSPSIIEHPAEPLESATNGAKQQQQQQEIEDDDSTPRGPRLPNPLVNGILAGGKGSPPQQQQQQQIQQLSRNLSTDTTASTPSSPAGAMANNRLSRRLTQTPSNTSLSQQSQGWSDSSLRAWLEDGSEIKDMMVMIHDKSGVVPVGDDHPLMVGLFSEQKKGVKDMMDQLDGLLGSYLERKGIALG